MKQCRLCAEFKELDQFAYKEKHKDKRQNECKSCNKIYRKEWYNKNKKARIQQIGKRNEQVIEIYQDFLVSYLKTHPCVDCGNDNILCLQFDHLRDKKYTISKMQTLSLETVKKEIDKCEVRCANCHAIKTAKFFGYYKAKAL